MSAIGKYFRASQKFREIDVTKYPTSSLTVELLRKALTVFYELTRRKVNPVAWYQPLVLNVPNEKLRREPMPGARFKAKSMKKQIISAATLSGYAVRGRDNEDLGCIEELMVSPCTGQIAYAVLSLGGFPGVGGKLLVVPWNALALDLEQRVFILEANRDMLSSAPSFQEEHWPDFGDFNFAQEVHRFYGLHPQWEAA